MAKFKFPQHFRFYVPIIDVLKELGGSGRSAEVADLVIDKANISDEELEETIKSGASKIRNQIHWARSFLVKIGYIDSSQRGVWTLTEKGLSSDLTEKDLPDLYKLRKEMGKRYREKRKRKMVETISDDEPDVIQDDLGDIGTSDFRLDLLNTLQTLPPSGFERICQRLLRESGFEQVTVTGKSGDGGIDGIGLLQVNPFVSFKVIFQCKRYQGSVSPSQIRDFRGAMLGRADKGIFITTGSFTSDAKKEARRDGVSPIELVDGEKLVEMFELVELGLKPIKTYELDDEFFDKFRD